MRTDDEKHKKTHQYSKNIKAQKFKKNYVRALSAIYCRLKITLILQNIVLIKCFLDVIILCYILYETVYCNVVISFFKIFLSSIGK